MSQLRPIPQEAFVEEAPLQRLNNQMNSSVIRLQRSQQVMNIVDFPPPVRETITKSATDPESLFLYAMYKYNKPKRCTYIKYPVLKQVIDWQLQLHHRQCAAFSFIISKHQTYSDNQEHYVPVLSQLRTVESRKTELLR